MMGHVDVGRIRLRSFSGLYEWIWLLTSFRFQVGGTMSLLLHDITVFNPVGYALSINLTL